MSCETQKSGGDPGTNNTQKLLLVGFFFTVRKSSCFSVVLQVFLVRKVTPPDANQLYAMKVLKKATLKGTAA